MTVTILGNNSALPAYGRHPTAQLVNIYGEVLLLDCGEGTQNQMQIFGLKWRRLQHIFISHLHGDHYFGLPGLLNSMSLLGRTLPLTVYGPPRLEGLIREILEVADTHLCYPYTFHPLREKEGDELVETADYKVKSFPVEHRIACWGFLIEQKSKGRRLLPEKCQEMGVPAAYFEQLKQGMDYTNPDGIIIKNETVTADGPLPKKYAYCADTLFTESFLHHIQGADTVYHECTYLEKDAEKAALRFHSTARQAALIAKMANAKQLLLGHFSSKYRELEAFGEEAATVFQNVKITEEGSTYEI